MALDFVLVNSTNELIENVKIDFQSHGELFDCMPVDEYPLLERIRDYYADAEYHPSELSNVVTELSEMLDSQSEDKNVRLLQSMVSLVEKALALDCKVEAIAD